MARRPLLLEQDDPRWTMAAMSAPSLAASPRIDHRENTQNPKRDDQTPVNHGNRDAKIGIYT
jgi:hypothetical protein